MFLENKSGWQDSNLRPPGPKPGTLAKLSHTPMIIYMSLSDTYSIIYERHCNVKHFFDFFKEKNVSQLKFEQQYIGLILQPPYNSFIATGDCKTQIP